MKPHAPNYTKTSSRRRAPDGVEFLIRPARRDELASIRDLLVETWHDTYDTIYGIERVTAITKEWHGPDRLARAFERQSHAFLVAEASDGILSATASATLGDDGLVTLGRLYVRPRCQGRGLGSAMLRACETWFARGRLMRLEVETKNAKARAFYAKRGFAERSGNSQGSEGRNIICEKAIGPPSAPSWRTLTIRPVRDEDGQELLGLIALCFAEYPGCLVDPHHDLADLVRPASAAAENGRHFWVVENGAGRIGACVSLDYPQAQTAELHRVYVRTDMRRRGLAGKLVALAESQARTQGAKRVFFWSDTRFLAAHHFYEQLAYRRTGEERELGDVSHSREYRFEKTL
ncbi:MAG: GNAT family N-acetyltransferase [Hyphomicrobiales bacterium]|nr:GNAT family N-acetyltransferase [Hyphomicrobiales bacterium]